MTDNKNKDSKKIFTLIILIAVVMVCTTSATYAYFSFTATNNNVVTGTAATADLSLTVTPAALKSGNTGKMVPQRESALGTAMNSTNKCVDGNNNVVCKVYTITLKNNGDATVKLNGTITFSGSGSMPNLKWRKTTDTVTLGTGTTTAAGTNTVQTLDSNKVLTAGQTVNYYIVIWINAQLSGTTEVAQTDTGTFTATIDFKSASGVGVTSTIT